MQQAPKTPYRFYRPYRPKGMGEGLKLEGVTTIFGLLGIGVLILVGISLLLVNTVPTEKELYPVEAELSSTPYRSAKFRNTLLIPFTNARVMKLEETSFTAIDTSLLFSLDKGDMLRVFMHPKEAENWNKGISRKDFYSAVLIQKAGDKTWILDYPTYRKKAAKAQSQGWCLIILGAILVPYQLIRNPKFPVWAAIGLYVLAGIIYYFLL
jgi:hypothetical protein